MPTRVQEGMKELKIGTSTRGQASTLKEGMKNEKRAFVATEGATKQQTVYDLVGATKRQKGSGSEDF
jgi:hypothetical protein